MKIVLTGAHGVGKSTLANLIGTRLNIVVLDDVTFHIINEQYNNDISVVNLKKNDEFQLKIVNEYLKRFNSFEEFISARSFVDHLAYSRVNNVSEVIQDTIANLIRDWKSRLIYVYVPIEIPLKGEDKRLEDIEFQKRVDEEIKSILKEFHISYLKVSGSIEERAKQILGGLYDFA